jgi:DNA topoisomerase I
VARALREGARVSLAIAPEVSAEEAGLRYVTDERPGIRRLRAGRGFRYLNPDGSALTDRHRLDWIRSLAIPPAWTDVWICADQRGHLQATGRDARGRKVYRYHPRWRQVRDEMKYERLIAFGRALPAIRRRVKRDLRLRGLKRDRVLALVIELLERTALRVGNEEYARENRSFGLTTLRGRHVTVASSGVRFRFRGKGGKAHEASVDDPRVARIVRRLQHLPGQELFQYVDEDGKVRGVGSEDVNAYLRQITGEDFSAKDFRTWAGTVAAARELSTAGEASSEREAKRRVVAAMDHVAEQLGNTRAVSRNAYVHPSIVEGYMDGGGISLNGKAEQDDAIRAARLSAAERAVLEYLRTAQGEPETTARNGKKRVQAASKRRSARR